MSVMAATIAASAIATNECVKAAAAYLLLELASMGGSPSTLGLLLSTSCKDRLVQPGALGDREKQSCGRGLPHADRHQSLDGGRRLVGQVASALASSSERQDTALAGAPLGKQQLAGNSIDSTQQGQILSPEASRPDLAVCSLRLAVSASGGARAIDR